VTKHAPSRGQIEVEAAGAELVRIVRASDWDPERAGQLLHARLGGDRRILRVLSGRVAANLLILPTELGERAELTLLSALSIETPVRDDKSRNREE
jgi:hypothetical protein